MNVTVVHRDAHLLVLSKPPRLPTTHPSGGDCLVRRATASKPDQQRHYYQPYTYKLSF